MAHLTDPRSQRAWENFRRWIAELGGEVLETEWLGNQVPHLCRCTGGHECRPMPNNVQQGHGICQICAKNDPVTAWESFRSQVTSLGGVVLEPEYRGNKKHHRCLCAEGHECRPIPACIQRGDGICRVCTSLHPSTAREKFYLRVTELGGVVLEQRWLSVKKPHHCLCVNGHECYPRPDGVQRGEGVCPICIRKAQDVLYVIRNQTTGWVKFGITNRDGSVRLRRHGYDGFTEVLRLETGLAEGLAAVVEQKIKTILKIVRAEPVRGYEYFSGEYLALILNEIEIWVD